MEGRAPDDVAAGILWVAISFSGTLAMGRTFERERYNDTLRALLLAPADRPAIYMGKLLGCCCCWRWSRSSWCRSSACCSARRSSRIRACWSRCWLLGTLGFAAVGTLFAAMLVRVRSRDTLLPCCCIR